MKDKKDRKGWLAVKIDLEKAYDRLKWEFIEDTLKDIGFPKTFTKLVMNYVSSPSLQVIWNRGGEAETPFHPKRGIRQGDP